MLEKLARDKHSSLLRKFVNYGWRKFWREGESRVGLACIYAIPGPLLSRQHGSTLALWLPSAIQAAQPQPFGLNLPYKLPNSARNWPALPWAFNQLRQCLDIPTQKWLSLISQENVIWENVVVKKLLRQLDFLLFVSFRANHEFGFLVLFIFPFLNFN